MSFIFDGTKPPSPERQQLAQTILRRKQMQQEASMAGPVAMPTDLGGGIQALGEGILGGLEDRALQHQATAPTDAWADMRQTGQQMPATNWAGGPMGSFGAPFKRLFG